MPLVLATVVEALGSTYRKAGARMLIGAEAVVLAQPAELLVAIGNRRTDAEVLMTHNIDYDARSLGELYYLPCRYLGVLIPNRLWSRPRQSGHRNKMKLTVALLLLLPSMAAAVELAVGDFDSNGLDQWHNKSFNGKTRYELVMDDGRQIVRAESNGAASGLYREQTIDLIQTPWLKWRWKVANVLEGVDETTKAGDDYPARVYVIFSGGLAFWRTRTVVYVWSSNQPAGSEWRNAFTDHARVIAVQSGVDKTGQWSSESRNVREDYKRLFGEDVEQADAVAIMTDTDNSGQQATAWYGNIRFSDQP